MKGGGVKTVNVHRGLSGFTGDVTWVLPARRKGKKTQVEGGGVGNSRLSRRSGGPSQEIEWTGV